MGGYPLPLAIQQIMKVGLNAGAKRDRESYVQFRQPQKSVEKISSYRSSSCDSFATISHKSSDRRDSSIPTTIVSAVSINQLGNSPRHRSDYR